MNKKIIIGALSVGVLAYFLLKKTKKETKQEEVNSQSETKQEATSETIQAPTASTPTSTSLDKKKVLTFGSKGKEVEELQKKLGGLTPDGNFGLKTQAKLMTTFSATKITLEQLYNWLPKVEYVQTIFPNLLSTFSRAGLYPLDLAFLKKWASAVKNKEPFFQYETSAGVKTYSSSTGKAQQQVSTLGGLVIYK